MLKLVLHDELSQLRATDFRERINVFTHEQFCILDSSLDLLIGHQRLIINIYIFMWLGNSGFDLKRNICLSFRLGNGNRMNKYL